MSSSAIERLLDSLIPLGTLLLNMASDVSVVIGSKFVDFLSISSTLASYNDGSGHIKLMQAVVIWLQTWYVLVCYFIFEHQRSSLILGFFLLQ